MMTGAAHLPGALLPLLMQTSLLWNLVFSSLIFGTRWEMVFSSSQLGAQGGGEAPAGR